MAEATARATDRYIVLQWNDYRKENFLSFAGGFSSFEKAVEVQIKCLKEFQDNGWIKDHEAVPVYPASDPTLPTRLVFPIRELDSSFWLEREGGTHQVNCKFIQVDLYGGNSECFMASIFIKSSHREAVTQHLRRQRRCT